MNFIRTLEEQGVGQILVLCTVPPQDLDGISPPTSSCTDETIRPQEGPISL